MAGGIPRMSAEARERLARFVREAADHKEPEWVVVERRIGSPGSPLRWERFRTERDERYGEGKWSVGYDWEDRFIPEDEAVTKLYNSSFHLYLSRNEEVVDTLTALAAELTDSSAKLRGDPFLEVNAITAALGKLGRELEGDNVVDLGIQNGLTDTLRATRVAFLGGMNGWSLEEFWFGEHRCIGQLI